MRVAADKNKAKQRHNIAKSSVRGNEESERWRLAVNHEKEMLRQGSEMVAVSDDTRRHTWLRRLGTDIEGLYPRIRSNKLGHTWKDFICPLFFWINPSIPPRGFCVSLNLLPSNVESFLCRCYYCIIRISGWKIVIESQPMFQRR